MNNDFSGFNAGIGKDPTMMDIIDNLDIEQTQEEQNKKGKTPKEKKQKRNGDLIKKIIFTVIVLFLMFGVGYGIYFYLSQANSKKTNKFSINNLSIFVGEELSTNLDTYGDFSKMDISSCDLDISQVNPNVLGDYVYHITCNGAIYSAKIKVIEKSKFKLETAVVYKKENESLNVKDFVSSKENYIYSFKDNELVQSYLNQPGGPYIIDIEAIDNNNKTENIYGILYVVNSEIGLKLNCSSSTMDNENYKYQIKDNFIFDNSSTDIGSSYRIENFIFTNEDQYYEALEETNNKQLTLENVTGYYLRDDDNLTISIISTLNKSILDYEYEGTFPESYQQITNFYENTKNYKCEH